MTISDLTGIYVKRRMELILISVYLFSGIFMADSVRNFLFFTLENILICLMFLLPLIFAATAAFFYKQNRRVDVLLLLCSILWVGVAGPKVLDDFSGDEAYYLFFLSMTLISMTHLFFLAYLRMKK